MFDQEAGWQGRIANATDEKLVGALERAVLQCRHDINALELGVVIDAGSRFGGGMVEELSWSKTEAQFDEIERCKKAEEDVAVRSL